MNATEEEAGVRKVEALVSIVLRAGVLASLVIMFTGLIVSFVRQPAYRTSSSLRHAIITGQAPFPHSLSSVLSGVGSGHGMAIIAIGLFVLLLTPIVRVAVSVAIYVIQRDKAFVLITIFVLAVLCASFFIGSATS